MRIPPSSHDNEPLSKRDSGLLQIGLLIRSSYIHLIQKDLSFLQFGTILTPCPYSAFRTYLACCPSGDQSTDGLDSRTPYYLHQGNRAKRPCLLEFCRCVSPTKLDALLTVAQSFRQLSVRSLLCLARHSKSNNLVLSPLFSKIVALMIGFYFCALLVDS